MKKTAKKETVFNLANGNTSLKNFRKEMEKCNNSKLLKLFNRLRFLLHSRSISLEQHTMYSQKIWWVGEKLGYFDRKKSYKKMTSSMYNNYLRRYTEEEIKEIEKEIEEHNERVKNAPYCDEQITEEIGLGPVHDLPDITGEEFDMLKQFVEENGIEFPIVKDPFGLEDRD